MIPRVLVWGKPAPEAREGDKTSRETIYVFVFACNIAHGYHALLPSSNVTRKFFSIHSMDCDSEIFRMTEEIFQNLVIVVDTWWAWCKGDEVELAAHKE